MYTEAHFYGPRIKGLYGFLAGQILICSIFFVQNMNLISKLGCDENEMIFQCVDKLVMFFQQQDAQIRRARLDEYRKSVFGDQFEFRKLTQRCHIRIGLYEFELAQPLNKFINSNFAESTMILGANFAEITATWHIQR